MERSARTRHLRQLISQHPPRHAAVNALVNRATALAPRMSARGVSTCFWSVAVLQREDVALFDALSVRAISLSKQLDVQVRLSWVWVWVCVNCLQLLAAKVMLFLQK